MDELAAALNPGKFAVIADIDEEWVTPVDTRLEPLGGIVLRTPRVNFEETHRARALESLRAELAQYEAELTRDSSDRRAKLQAAAGKLKDRLQATLDRGPQARAGSGSKRKEP